MPLRGAVLLHVGEGAPTVGLLDPAEQCPAQSTLPAKHPHQSGEEPFSLPSLVPPRRIGRSSSTFVLRLCNELPRNRSRSRSSTSNSNSSSSSQQQQRQERDDDDDKNRKVISGCCLALPWLGLACRKTWSRPGVVVPWFLRLHSFETGELLDGNTCVRGQVGR